MTVSNDNGATDEALRDLEASILADAETEAAMIRWLNVRTIPRPRRRVIIAWLPPR